MKTFKIICIAVLLAAFVKTPCAKAQIPVNDAAWQLQDAAHGTEEFNSSLDLTKWYITYPWFGSDTLTYGGGAELAIPSNVKQSGTTLKIKSDTLIPGVKIYPSKFGTDSITYVYDGGVLWRKRVSGVDLYKYGYVEISAKYPTGCYSLWVAFWLYMADACAVPPYYDEFDILENGGANSFAGNNAGTNYHLYQTGSCPDGSDNTSSSQDIPLSFNQSSGFHKYAVEWDPHKFTYYIDDTPVRSVFDPTGAGIPQHAMTAILSSGIYPWDAYLPTNWNDSANFPPDGTGHGNQKPVCFHGTTNPQYFEIDYLHYYKLNVNCSSDLNPLCTPSTDYSTRAVYRSITTGVSCSPTFNTSDSYTLRATDYVVLGAGTTINPNGSGFFAAQTQACPQ